jgi:hypothetical protein
MNNNVVMAFFNGKANIRAGMARNVDFYLQLIANQFINTKNCDRRNEDRTLETLRNPKGYAEMEGLPIGLKSRSL